MEKYISDEHIHQGHRARMRQKLINHGQHIFDTYELLEMLLYYVIPYRDTNPIAKRLLMAFGDLDGVLSASSKELSAHSGIGERAGEFLSLVGRLRGLIGAEQCCVHRRDMSDYDSVGAYLVEAMRGISEKQTVALYLDSSMRLIKYEKMFDLDFDSGGIKPGAIIDMAMRCSASVVITAHNHYYGPFCPTQGDRASLEMINLALSAAGIIHAEHYIICGDRYAGMGSLKNFGIIASQNSALDKFLSGVEGHSSEGGIKASAGPALKYSEIPFGDESAATPDDSDRRDRENNRRGDSRAVYEPDSAVAEATISENNSVAEPTISENRSVAERKPCGRGEYDIGLGYDSRDLAYFTELLSYAVGDGAEDTARRLIKKYQSVENSLTASVRELSALTSEKCAVYLKLLASVTSRRTTDLVKVGGVYSEASIGELLKALFIGESVEKVYILGFDSKQKFLGIEVLGEGTVNASEVMPRRAIESALAMGAGQVSIAHNHPFGNTTPSRDDLQMTKKFISLFESVGVKFNRHYVVAGQLIDAVEV